ncbi:MAG: TIGR03087 family PEP-CTERM/XrtA system glycosyltransferase [Rhodospirillaceae bacterium]
MTPSRSLLFLCHRIPFPPDKGEKIRAFRILEHLARSYRINLGCFIDDADDKAHVAALEPYCAELRCFDLPRETAKFRAVKGLLTGSPLTVASFANAAMGRWVSDILAREKHDVVFVYSSAMAQYVIGRDLGGAQLVMDFVDVDSDKWRQYAAETKGPMRWIYRREAAKLLAFDRRVAAAADAGLFVSDAEAALWRTLAPEAAGKTYGIANGIDCRYFSPRHVWSSPFTTPGPHFVFTGTMDYWPNVDAVKWFASAIFPKLRAARPEATFTVVGAKPTTEVTNLQSQAGVHVTGRVADVRPYLAHAHVAVAPMRIARGIQNKVLEAMAMAKPVVTTAQGLEGIEAVPDRHLMLANSEFEIFQACLRATEHDAAAIGLAARRLMEESYTWEGRLRDLDDILARGTARLESAREIVYSRPSCAPAGNRVNAATTYARGSLE